MELTTDLMARLKVLVVAVEFFSLLLKSRMTQQPTKPSIPKALWAFFAGWSNQNIKGTLFML